MCHQLFQGLFYTQFTKNRNTGLFSNPAVFCSALDEITACSFQNEQLSLEVALFPFRRKVNPTVRSSPTHPGATGEFMQGAQLLRNVIKLNICQIYTLNPLI